MSEVSEVEVEAFRGTLSIAKAYTQSRGLVPVLGNFCFVRREVMTSNGKAGFRGEVGWDAGEPGVGLEAGRVVSLLGSLPGEKILKIERRGDKIRMVCESFRAVFNAASVEEFPRIGAPGETGEFPTGIWEAVRRVYFSVSQDETKQPLRGIQISGAGKQWAAYSSDSYRISRVSLPRGFGASILIPDILLAPIISHEASPVRYGLSDNLFWAYFENYEIHGALLAEKFPDVEPFFSKSRAGSKRGVQVAFDNGALQEALGRLLLFSPDPPHRVVLTISPGTSAAVVSAESTAVGSAEERVPVEHNAKEKVVVHVSGKLLGEAVATAQVCVLQGGTDPLYFIDREAGFEHLLLPLHQG